MASTDDLEISTRLVSPLIEGKRIKGTGVLGGSLDVCVFFEERPHAALFGLRIATGNPARARVSLEAIRHRGANYLDGETSRILEEHAAGAIVVRLACAPGDRRVELLLDANGRALTLSAECFGAQGNWFLLDANGDVLTSARRRKLAERRSLSGRNQEPALPSDPEAWLTQRAQYFTELDQRLRTEAVAAQLGRDLTRERKGLAARIQGLVLRQAAEKGSGQLRRDGELLLTLPSGDRRGQTEVEVADWHAEGKPRLIALDPKLSIRDNAARRFKRAKRLEEGASHTANQIEEARAKAAEVEELTQRLADFTEQADDEGLQALAHDIHRLVRPRQRAPRRHGKPVPRKPYRTYCTRDGLSVLVGRTSADNDRLTLSIARGNDVWLHIAGGVQGSHVVLRIERGKSAPLESLLDAGTLALWFSKARGRPRAEVLWTPRKHVRKPKGLAPGKVEVVRSKTLLIDFEKERLARLLATGKADA